MDQHQGAKEAKARAKGVKNALENARKLHTKASERFACATRPPPAPEATEPRKNKKSESGRVRAQRLCADAGRLWAHAVDSRALAGEVVHGDGGGGGGGEAAAADEILVLAGEVCLSACL